MRINWRKLLRLPQPPEVMVCIAPPNAMSEYIIKARGGEHGYDWQQICINSHHNNAKLAYARAEEYAKEIKGTVKCG